MNDDESTRDVNWSKSAKIFDIYIEFSHHHLKCVHCIWIHEFEEEWYRHKTKITYPSSSTGGQNPAARLKDTLISFTCCCCFCCCFRWRKVFADCWRFRNIIELLGARLKHWRHAYTLWSQTDTLLFSS